MSSAVEVKAQAVRAPTSDGTNPSTVRRYTLDLAARSDAVPAAWQGQYVTLKAIGADCYWFFSHVSTALPEAAEAAANNGNPDPALGWLLRDGEVMDVLVPMAPRVPGTNDAIYFARDGSDNGASVWMRLSSGDA